MDEMTGAFGRLSTDAREWRPSNQPAQSQHVPPVPQSARQATSSSWSQESDLNASAVKEFVPGRAWSSRTTSGGSQDPQQSWTTTTTTTSSPTTAAQPHESSYGGVYAAEGAVTDSQPQIYETTIPAGPTPPPTPAFRSLHSLGLSDDLWRYHRDLAMESGRQMDPSDSRHKTIPPPYCNAFCMDTNKSGRSSFGYHSEAYQVVSRDDGYLYCLRRFEGVRCVSPKIANAVLEKWAMGPIKEHPGIVPLYRCFVAHRAVFFVHQYVPGARTLKERLGGPLSEAVLWSGISQLVAAIRVVHSNNLAVRTIQLQHILSNYTSSSGSRLRLRLNCAGVVDALEFEARKNLADLQCEDVRDLGRLILSLASGTEIQRNTDNDTMAKCEAFLLQNYSRDLHNLVMTLIRSVHPPSILDVSRAMAGRAFEEMDGANVALDRSERALAAEYESGRVLRLLLKLGFINERPEMGLNRRWAQSGDCYVLTLFRDYVFHQADGRGNPVLDLGHVMTALNKLDAADEEKIILTSRDGKTLMVVSYADVARCLDSAFHELCAGSVPPNLHY